MSIIDELLDIKTREATTTMIQQINQVERRVEETGRRLDESGRRIEKTVRRVEVLDDRTASVQAQTKALGARMVATLSYSTESWLTNHHETLLKPLIADIYHAFVQKAISLLEKTHPSLVPARITDDDSRIPLFAAFVQSIPTEVHEAWGLPGYQMIMGNQFFKVSDYAGDPIERT
ncbi:MAG: hypothetical protein Q9205_004526 [Flavoplaca limonia]